MGQAATKNTLDSGFPFETIIWEAVAKSYTVRLSMRRLSR